MEFYYKQGDEFKRLPEWCFLFVNIGRIIGEFTSEKERTVIAVSVPTRAYAAIFTALGLVLARAEKKIGFGDKEEYFLKLCQLPPGTSVKYRDRNRLKKGVIEGVFIRNGKKEIKIRVSDRGGGFLTYIVNSSTCSRVLVSGEKIESLPKNQKGRLIDPSWEFLSKCFGYDKAMHFITESEIYCNILGRKYKLTEEMETLDIFLRDKKDGYIKGSAKNILRPEGIYKEKGGFHTIIATPYKYYEICDYAIFDCALYFIRAGDKYRNSNLVLIIDRTDSYHDLIIDYIYQQLSKWKKIKISQQAKELAEAIKSISLPDGVRLAYFFSEIDRSHDF